MFQFVDYWYVVVEDYFGYVVVGYGQQCDLFQQFVCVVVEGEVEGGCFGCGCLYCGSLCVLVSLFLVLCRSLLLQLVGCGVMLVDFVCEVFVMCILYFVIEFYCEFILKVSDLYMLYIEECGMLEGILVVYLYGGLGVGILLIYCCFFNLVCYCIVLIDQCGSGCFMLFGELCDNIMQDLVVDIEKVCEYLGIECWLVYGGLWGFMLLLVYVQVYFECVIGLIVCGVFFGCEMENCWFVEVNGGVCWIFLECWDCYEVYILEVECGDMIVVYWLWLDSVDEMICIEVVQVWLGWEDNVVILQYDVDV